MQQSKSRTKKKSTSIKGKSTTSKHKKNRAVSKIRDMSKEQMTIAGYLLFAVYDVFLLYRYYRAIWWLDPIVFTINPLIIALSVGLPFLLWAYSTQFDRFNFHERKRLLLHCVITNGIGNIIQVVPYIANRFLVSRILQIELTENMTKGMVIMLGRIAVLIPLVIAFLLIEMPVKHFIESTEMQEKIDVFKITHHVDLRENKDTLYDLNIIRDLKTGKMKTIKENDRFVHLFINGASGTGKTSSTISRAIECDLNKKVENMQKREAELLKMVKEKKAVVIAPLANKNITEYDIKPYKKYYKDYLAVYKKYPDCGITVMAPNNSLNDDVVKLANARKIYVNVVDPAKIYEEAYTRRLGINPFYIPFGLSEKERQIAITDAAQNFSEVMVAANETAGSSDQYFRDINTSVSTNIALACMLANNISHKQTSITEIQQCIGNFKDLEPYVATIEDYYGISITVEDTGTKKGNDNAVQMLTKNREVSNRSNGKNNDYYETIHFIKQELLGPGAEKMFDQARGLRNLINKLLRDPRFKELLTVPPEKAINFDDILRKSEITVVNTALEFGQQQSTAFGLFFMLNHDVAVKKRKKTERTPHFLWIDEASQYMHRMYDDMIALYRQYRVAVGLAMQSISQMEKSVNTKYLKDVILGAGTQIVFGRVSAEEMKMYSELAGVQDVDIVQKAETSTSMFTTSASQNYSERVQADKANIQEGSNIRIRDFQEVTVFTIDNGRVLPGYTGKLNFVAKQAFEDQHVKRVNWAKYARGKKQEKVLTKPAKSVVEEQEALLKRQQGSISVIDKNISTPMAEVPVENTRDIIPEGKSLTETLGFFEKVFDDTALYEDINELQDPEAEHANMAESINALLGSGQESGEPKESPMDRLVNK